MRMQKLLIISLGLSTAIFSGCSKDRIADRISEKVPWVYKIDIQQGNVVTQEMVDQLEPGMEQRQVAYLLGSPMIADPFHQDRWDYPYSFKPGGEPAQVSGITLFFADGKLTRIEGDLQPSGTPSEPRSRKMTVTVPYQEQEKPGILTRIWRWITFGGEREDR